jgi:hypothetical protein
LVRRKYRRLFSSMPRPKKRGPKGPDEALIQAIVELKSRNPRFGCPRIARIISQTFGIDVDKNVVYVIPTATCRLLFVLVILAHKRRRVIHIDRWSVTPSSGSNS